MPLGAIIANAMNGFTEPAPLTFWEVDSVGYTVNPVAYDPIEGGDTPPWN